MRYLVRAKVKSGLKHALLRAIERRVLGRGSVAEGEYLRNMTEARVSRDGTVKWVEVCFCSMPLAEERPYWEQYFELKTRILAANAATSTARRRGHARAATARGASRKTSRVTASRSSSACGARLRRVKRRADRRASLLNRR
jgi:hypothetical protein